MADDSSNISRRTVFAIPLAVVLAGNTLTAHAGEATVADAVEYSTVVPALVPSTVSKLFAQKIPEQVYSIRTSFKPTEEKYLSVNIQKQSSIKTREFENIRELVEVFDPGNPTEITKEQAQDALFVKIEANRLSADIAATTGRGNGNTIVIHENTIFNMKDIRETSHFEILTFNSGSGPDVVRPDEILILYDRSRHVEPEIEIGREKPGYFMLDGPFIAEILPDGRVKAVILENEKSTLGNASDFGRFIKAV
jgi:hypothetical protein